MQPLRALAQDYAGGRPPSVSGPTFIANSCSTRAQLWPNRGQVEQACRSAAESKAFGAASLLPSERSSISVIGKRSSHGLGALSLEALRSRRMAHPRLSLRAALTPPAIGLNWNLFQGGRWQPAEMALNPRRDP